MKVKKAAKRAMRDAIRRVAEHLRLENGAWANHDEWIREAAIQVGDALVALVCPAGEHKERPETGEAPPIPHGAWWDGEALVLYNGGRVTVAGDGAVRIQHPDRGRLFDAEGLMAARAVLAKAQRRATADETRNRC